MKKKIVYSNEPLGDIEVIPDFLPPLAELAFREEGVKVTPYVNAQAERPAAATFKRASPKRSAA